MEENNQKIEDITGTGTLIGEVWYKPQWAVIVCCFIAFLLCLTANYMAIILAVFIFAISFFVNHSVKDYKTVEVYDYYLIIYSAIDDETGRRILCDDIVEWTCKNGNNAADALMIELEGGEVVYKNTFQIAKLFRYLNKVIPEKESKRIQEEKNKNTKLKFSWPFKKKK